MSRVSITCVCRYTRVGVTNVINNIDPFGNFLVFFKIFKLQVDYLYVTFILDRGHYKCDSKDNWERYFIKIRNVPNGETKEVLVTPTPGHYRVMHGAVAFYCIEHATITRRVRCLVKYSSLIGPATLSAARVSSGMGLNMIRAWPHPPE